MKKLLELLKALDNNLLTILLFAFIFAIPLYPKFPLIFIEYTYIYIRAEDFFVALLNVAFLVQLLRGKAKLNTQFLLLFFIFWGVVVLSFLWNTFISHALLYRQVAILHALRRFEYMSIFFIASSTIHTLKTFKKTIFLLAISLFLVNLYGLGQRFFGFPAVSTMNPAFARGGLLLLTPEARISSTFAGHYDLAAFLVLVNPIMWGFYFYKKAPKIFLLVNIFLTYIILMFTASRSSLIGYISTPLFLLFIRKFKYAAVVTILSLVIFHFSGDLAKRVTQTFQIKQILVNEKTGQVYVPQQISSKNLAAGSAYIQFDKKKTNALTDAQKSEIIQQATAGGKMLSTSESASLLANSENVQPVSSVVADTSFSTRLQVEWPRAINAFKSNPILGTGASSITESSDGDYFRMIGEFGLFGLVSFGFILYSIARFVLDKSKNLDKDSRPLYLGMLFGLLGLLVNALLIDVFEASKVAFMLWFILGSYIGFLSNNKNLS